METESNRIVEQALSLPADVRLRLVDALLESLNLPAESEIDRLWAEEAERRVAELEAGTARTVPAEEVLEKLKEKYGE
ncbi:MAG: addiction module protein [Desulfococcaceae bacterium]